MAHYASSNGHGNGTSVQPVEKEDEIYRRIVIVTSVGYVCAILTIFMVINDKVPSPYMDEVFHVGQARAYCVGNFTQWDPKITTPPGLYLTTLGFLKPFSELYAFGEEDAARICPTFMLRFINLIFASANAYIMYLIGLNLMKSATRAAKVNLLLSTFSLATFPPLFFFTFFYYTDAGSLFFVLLMYLYHIYNQEWLASLFGAISLLYRQTNIVWLFFLAAYTSLRIIMKHVERSKKKTKTSQIIIAVSPQILMTCGGYAITGSAFLGFIILNKGIVVGDRSAHEAALHFPQLLYFAGFVSFFSFPWIFTLSNVKNFLALASKHKTKFVVAAFVSAILLKKFTFVHPYLLADNRHYTFYVWRRLLGRDSMLPYLVIPLYMFAAHATLSLLHAKDALWKTLFLTCVSISIVPQQLLEFRYFIIPYVIWRLNIAPNSTCQLIIEFVANILINCFVLYMFLYAPFKWSNSKDWQRFMW